MERLEDGGESLRERLGEGRLEEDGGESLRERLGEERLERLTARVKHLRHRINNQLLRYAVVIIL
jgi:hypothetical protein